MNVPLESLEQIRTSASCPIVIFPECTTSNGRGLLRFADVFVGTSIPVRHYQVFVMCIRYDPPSVLKPTCTHSIPSQYLNPFLAFFSIASSVSASNVVSIRLLAQSESPSSSAFVTSDYVTSEVADELAEACAALIANLGKIKRTGQGWEDKAAFLAFYREKSRKKSD